MMDINVETFTSCSAERTCSIALIGANADLIIAIHVRIFQAVGSFEAIKLLIESASRLGVTNDKHHKPVNMSRNE
jgi:hypothetical protein